MSAALERQVLAAPLVDFVTTNAIPVSWPNISFDSPVDDQGQAARWIRFALVAVKSQQVEMGSPGQNTGRSYGSLILQIFVPVTSGDGDALDLADQLAGLYVQKLFPFTDVPPSGHVRMRNATIKQIGVTTNYYQVNVTIPFQRDDLQ